MRNIDCYVRCRKAFFNLLVWLPVLVNDYAYSQDTIPLTLRQTTGFTQQYIRPGLRLENKGRFKGLPDKASEFEVYAFNFQKNQSHFTNRIKGYYSNEQWDIISRYYGMDTVGVRSITFHFSVIMPG